MPIGYQKQIDTLEQSQLEPMFQYYLMKEIKLDVVLTANALRDAEVIAVSAGHGIVTGNRVVLCNGVAFQQCEVTNVATNNISIRVPLSFDFPIIGTIMTVGDIEMNKDFSATPADFVFRIRGGVIPLDVSGAILTMMHTAQPGDNLFGGITALTKGIFARRIDGVVQPLGAYARNSDFRDFGWTVTYPVKVPSEDYATEVRLNFVDVFGKEIRIDPRTSDYMHMRARDKMDTGMSKMRCAVYGSYTLGE